MFIIFLDSFSTETLDWQRDNTDIRLHVDIQSLTIFTEIYWNDQVLLISFEVVILNFFTYKFQSICSHFQVFMKEFT